MEITNWAQTIRFTPASVEHPASVEDVVRIVRKAEEDLVSVRALGSHWSYTDIVHQREVVVRLTGMTQVHGFLKGQQVWHDSVPRPGEDRAAAVFGAFRPEARTASGRFAYFQAGVTVKQLAQALDRPDPAKDPGLPPRDRWALMTMGASSGQTVAGAAATGTHGGDFVSPPIADWVRAIHLVGPGGVQHWLERGGLLRLTDPAALAAAVPGLRIENIRYSDDEFLAALVGVGSLGVVVELIVQARPQYGLSQQVAASTWSAVQAAFRGRRLFVAEPLGIRHPRALGSAPTAVQPTPEGLEIFLNPYRTDDDYQAATSGDRSCVVVSRARAVAAGSDVFDPPPGPTPGAGYGLDFLTTVEGGGPREYRGTIDGILKNARTPTTGFPTAYSVLATYDGTGDAIPGAGMEFTVPADDERWIGFVDALLAAFDQQVRNGMKLAGFFSLRFTETSSALLAMQHAPLPETLRRGKVCHVEVLALKEGPVSWDHSGNLEGWSDRVVQAFEQVAAAFGARMHWGLLHQLDRARVEDTYPSTWHAWRRVKTELSAPGRAATFSSDFTRRCGLEGNTEVLALASWDADRYDLFGYDATGQVLQLWWNGAAWHRTRLEGAFPAGQRLVGPLCAVASGVDRIDLFGIGRNGHLLRVSWRGAWPWRFSDLGRPFGEDEFLGPLAAASWGPGRIDLFGVGRSGGLLHLWWEGDAARFQETRALPFPDGQRLAGSLSAASPGAGRLELVGLGRDRHLLRAAWTGSGWLAMDLGRHLWVSGPPAVTCRGSDECHVFAPLRDGQLGWIRYLPSESGRVRGSRAFLTQFPGVAPLYGMPPDFSPWDPGDGHYVYHEKTVPVRFAGPIVAASWPGGQHVFGLDEKGRVRQVMKTDRVHSFDLGTLAGS